MQRAVLAQLGDSLLKLVVQSCWAHRCLYDVKGIRILCAKVLKHFLLYKPFGEKRKSSASDSPFACYAKAHILWLPRHPPGTCCRPPHAACPHACTSKSHSTGHPRQHLPPHLPTMIPPSSQTPSMLTAGSQSRLFPHRVISASPLPSNFKSGFQ